MPGVVVRSLPQHLRVEPLSSRWRPKLDPLAQAPRLKKKLAPPFTSLSVSQSNGGWGHAVTLETRSFRPRPRVALDVLIRE